MWVGWLVGCNDLEWMWDLKLWEEIECVWEDFRLNVFEVCLGRLGFIKCENGGWVVLIIGEC